MRGTLTLLAFIVAPPLWGGGTGGAAPFNFLFLDADARPAALGGAYTALARDAHALLYNPAGLAFADRSQAAFMHTEHFQGVGQDYGALALRGPLGGWLGEGSGAGFMVNTVGYGDIQRTTLSNPRGLGLGSFGIRGWEVAVGYGEKLRWDWIGAGFGVKYLSEEIDGYAAQAGALDLGILADLDAPLGVPAGLGLSLQNLGTKAKYQSSREDLPLNLRVGASWRFLGSGLLALDLNQPAAGGMTLHLGAEYAFLKTAAVRLGFNGRNETDSGVTAGGGIALQGFTLDYAFVPFGDLGASHRFSFSYRW